MQKACGRPRMLTRSRRNGALAVKWPLRFWISNRLSPFRRHPRRRACPRVSHGLKAPGSRRGRSHPRVTGGPKEPQNLKLRAHPRAAESPKVRRNPERRARPRVSRASRPSTRAARHGWRGARGAGPSAQRPRRSPRGEARTTQSPRRGAAPATQHLRCEDASGANANNRRLAPPRAGLEIGTTLMRSKSSQRSSGGNDDGDVSIERDAGPRSDFEFGFLMTLADIDVLKNRGSSSPLRKLIHLG